MDSLGELRRGIFMAAETVRIVRGGFRWYREGKTGFYLANDQHFTIQKTATK
jgi:hypothetical protein